MTPTRDAAGDNGDDKREGALVEEIGNPSGDWFMAISPSKTLSPTKIKTILAPFTLHQSQPEYVTAMWQDNTATGAAQDGVKAKSV